MSVKQAVHRTKLKDRKLPNYTKGEEIFNMVTHIVGGGLGIIVLVMCVIRSALHHDPWAIVGSALFGFSMILLYTMSAVYHGLHIGMGKKVLQVLDHCTIYFLIGGTYTPVLLCSIRSVSPGWAWGIFGGIWAIAALAIVFTAIDLKKYKVLSMICYIGMGWCIVLAVRPTIQALNKVSLMWLLGGGIAYTVGAVLYGVGKKHRYIHSVFHIMVVLGSIMHSVLIYFYIV